MTETHVVFPNGLAAIRDWAEKSARSGLPHAIDPELVLSLSTDIEELESRVKELEVALRFYAEEENWTTMAPNEFRKRHGEEPSSEVRFGRMRLVAPGRALPLVLKDLGGRARLVLATD